MAEPSTSNVAVGEELLIPQLPEASMVKRVLVSSADVPILNLSASELSTPIEKVVMAFTN